MRSCQQRYLISLNKDNILAHVQELTPYLEEKLDKLVDKYPIVAARRGKGFMQGLVITGTTVGSVVTKALENGLLVISARSDTASSRSSACYHKRTYR